MFRLLLPVLGFGVVLYTFLDVILTDSSQVRNLPKITWIMLLIFIFPVGAIGWFVGGRPTNATAVPGASRSRGGTVGRNASNRGNPRHPSQRPAPPKGPDDDPDFLRRLDERMRRQQREREQDGEADGDG